MNGPLNARARQRARGVTLIEVLVALVIVAVGLLGLAGLQVRGLSIQKDAHGRAIATQMALDLADRMRANRDPATRVPPAGYAYTAAYPTGVPTVGNATTDCGAGACDLAEQAQYDLLGSAARDGWIDRVTQSLPGGWANVQSIDATNQVWNVTVMWVETGFRGRAAASDAVTLAALNNNRTCPAGTPAQVECQTIRVRP